MAKMRLLVVLLLLLLLQPAPVVPAGQHRRQHYSSGSQLHPMAGNMATAPRGAGGGSLLSAAVAAVGQAAPLHLPLQHAGGKPIDARVDYGCVGDGHADDTACLQAALDAGGVQGRRVYIPGGAYAVSEPLLLKGSNSTWANQQWNATFGPIPVSGDGTGQTIIRAAASGKWGGESDRIAVLFFPTCCGALPQSGGGWHLADLSVDANNTVDYGILAPAVYSSSFQRIGVTGALVCGMHIGWGWCNMIEDSTFELNYIGLVLNNAVNNVNVINSAFLDNEVGLYISGGMQMNIEGNVFEGNGGPGAIVFDARALTLDSNYFEGNNGHERAMSGHPFTMVPEDLASGWSNITTTADIIFTGCPSFNDGNSWVGQPGAPIQRLPAWCFGKGYPSSAVIYSGNIHAPDGGLGGGHAVLVTAVDGAKFQGNALNAYINDRVYQSSRPQQACGKAFPPKAGDQGSLSSALVGIGTGDLFLARHLTFETNDGWCHQTSWPAASSPPPARLSNGGVLQLLWPTSADKWRHGVQSTLPAALSWDTIRIITSGSEAASYSSARWHFAESIAPHNWGPVPGVQPVTASKLSRVLDGHPLYAVSCADDECAAAVLSANLTDFPSLAGQAVHIGLQLRGTGDTLTSATFRLEISDGQSSMTTANASVSCDNSAWLTHTAYATLGWTGWVNMTLRMFGAAALEVGTVTVAPIGQTY